MDTTYDPDKGVVPSLEERADQEWVAHKLPTSVLVHELGERLMELAPACAEDVHNNEGYCKYCGRIAVKFDD